MAQLVFEDKNPYDAMAIRVDIQGRTVGYFSRADARRYRTLLDGRIPLLVQIVGGWNHAKSGKGSFGVRLAFEMKD